jgi:hypothetical protein
MTQTPRPRLKVIGGRGQWYDLDERQLRRFRYFLLHDNKMDETYWAASYMLRGIVVERNATLQATTRHDAHAEAKRTIEGMALPEPQRGVRT